VLVRKGVTRWEAGKPKSGRVFELGGREIAERGVQADVFEPADRFEDG
jgi:hypothetical protein